LTRWAVSLALVCVLTTVCDAADVSASTVRTVAGGGGGSPNGGSALAANFGDLSSIGAMADGGFYVGGGPLTGSVYRVTPGGLTSRVAGRTDLGRSFGGDGGPATDGIFCYIAGVLERPDGSVLVVDRENHRIRRIGSDAQLTTFSGNGHPEEDMNDCTSSTYYSHPGDIEPHPDGGLLVADEGRSSVDYLPAIGGMPVAAAGGFRNPVDVSVASDGSILVAAYVASRIYKISYLSQSEGSGSVSGFAGDGTHNGFAGDGGPATAAKLRHPTAVAALPGGGAVIADTDNHRIRYVDPTGTISTIAGGGANSGDGPALSASLGSVREVVPTAAGLLMAEFNSRVRLLDKTDITKAPAAFIDSPDTSIEFDSWYPGPTFQCRVDAAQWATCASPMALTGLADGTHSFEVRGIDGLGADPTPARREFTVDTGGPNTIVTSAPEDPTRATSTSISFASPQPSATFECSLDEAAYAGCVSPVLISSLTNGPHVFRVRSSAGGEIDTTPAEVRWTVDTVPPTSAFIETPPTSTVSRTATFSFSSPDAGASFECTLDAETFAVCSSPLTRTTLQEGEHTFRVRAIDSAGNVQSPPLAHVWTIDPSPPDTSIVSGPAPFTPETLAVFDLASDEPGVSFSCGLDTETLAACPNPKAFAGLAEGPHHFRAVAKDAAGNADESPAEHRWTIDHSTPTAPTLSAPAPGQTGVPARPEFRFAAGTDVVSGVSTHEIRIDGSMLRSLPVKECAEAAICEVMLQDALIGGAHQWTVTARDRAGNVAASAAGTFTVDASPPVGLAAISPADGQRLGDDRPTLQWARPADSGSGIEGYDVKIGDRPSVHVSAESVRVADRLPDGEHVWSVVAVDAAGNRTPAVSRAFRVDRTPPSLALAPLPKVVVGRTVTVDASSSSDPDGGRIVRYEFDTDADGTVDQAGPEPAVTFTMASAGTRSVRVRALDEVGNAATAETGVEGETIGSSGEPELTTALLNDGAFATRKLDVTLDVRPPSRLGVATMIISNEGSPPVGAERVPIRGPLNDVRWRLAEGDGSKTPREVHVFFLNAAGRQVGDAPHDQIVFDPTPPSITEFVVTGNGKRRRVRVKARDRIVGVDRVEVRVGRRIVARRRAGRKGKAQLVARVRVRRAGLITVRAYDRAGGSTVRSERRGRVRSAGARWVPLSARP
jgi:hypothetical protein